MSTPIPDSPSPNNPPRPAAWYQVLRAALLPFLIILLVAGISGMVGTIQTWLKMEATPPEGWGAGFVGMAVILVGLLSLFATLLSGTWLWLLWRPKKKS